MFNYYLLINLTLVFANFFWCNSNALVTHHDISLKPTNVQLDEQLPDNFNNVDISFEFITDIEKFSEENPKADVVSMERQLDAKGPNDVVIYTIGERKYGDRLVASGRDRITFLTPRDFRQVFEYPASGIGATVTFVQINCEQDNTLGTAYIISGGIGQRRIVVGVEAYSTTVFGYELYIFGIP